MPAIENGKLVSVSASQITTFLKCRRQWWYGYVQGIRRPKTKSMEGGESVHTAMEGWYLEGTLPDPEQAHPDHRVGVESALYLVQSGLLPSRDSAILIETPKDYNMGMTLAGVDVRGKADMIVPGEGVWDWKTVKQLKWAVQDTDLEHNIQLTIYGAYYFSLFPNMDSLIYAHGNILTSKVGYSIRKSDPISRETVLSRYKDIEKTVMEMQETIAMSDVPGNRDACWDYGGCYYRNQCPTFKPSSLLSEITDGTYSMAQTLADILAQKRAEQNVTEIPVSSINPSDALPPQQSEKYEPPPDTQPDYSHTGPSPFKGLTLLIGVHPIKGFDGQSITPLEQLIHERTPRVLKKLDAPANVQDVRELGRTGIDELICDFRNNPPRGVVFTDKATLSLDIVSVLKPLADAVVE